LSRAELAPPSRQDEELSVALPSANRLRQFVFEPVSLCFQGMTIQLRDDGLPI